MEYHQIIRASAQARSPLRQNNATASNRLALQENAFGSGSSSTNIFNDGNGTISEGFDNVGVNLKRNPFMSVSDNNDKSANGDIHQGSNPSLVTLRRKEGKRLKLSSSLGKFNDDLDKSISKEVMMGEENAANFVNESHITSAKADETDTAESTSKPTQQRTNLSLDPVNLEARHPELPTESFDITSLYSKEVICPPSMVLKGVYEDVMKVEEEEMERNKQNVYDYDITQYDQTYLNEAEILSFEKVVLPSISCCEEEALKKVQAIVQRDCPELRIAVQRCRKFVYSSITAATEAAKQSRLERSKMNRIREEQWTQEHARKLAEEERLRQLALAKKKTEQARIRELLRIKKQRELKKKFPQNQETWKEVAFLMKELSHLQKDEGRWDQGLADLDQQEQELAEQEKAFKEQLEQYSLENQKEKAMKISDEAEEVSTPLAESEDIIKITKCVEDIMLSTNRIEQGLQIAAGVVTDSETIRQELYEEYTRHHQFQGYQGIHNPKGLLKALSQSQDDSEW